MTNPNPYSHLDCDFRINKSRRAKRIGLRIKAPRTVILTLPIDSNLKQALRFAAKHEAWVANKLTNLAIKEEKRKITITPDSSFSTKEHTFEFVPHDKEKAYIRITKNTTTLHYPKQWSHESSQMQDFIQVALQETYRTEAKSYIPQRVKELATACEFNYEKVAIKNSKTRWGSCSSKKNLNFSLWLMKLPYPLIDYIILHELCHTIHMNHGKEFHALLDKLCEGKSKELNKAVKGYAIV